MLGKNGPLFDREDLCWVEVCSRQLGKVWHKTEDLNPRGQEHLDGLE